MAITARKESEEASEVKAPDFERAIRVMRGDIAPAEEKSASTRGDLSAAWKVISNECHVEKAAAKVFRQKVLECSSELRDDFLRSLFGLMKASNLGISQDLVDRMNGTDAPTMPIAGREADRGNGAAFDEAAPKPAATELEDIEFVDPPAGVVKPRSGGRRPNLVTV